MNRSSITPFCVSAFVIYRNTSEYLLLRRSSSYMHGTWQMISGGIQEGETAWQAAKREIFEETALIPDRFYSADAIETFYCTELDQVVLVPVFVADIKEKHPIKLSHHEHDAYEWLSFEEAQKRLVWSEQRRIIHHIHEQFIVLSPSPLLAIDLLKSAS